MTPKEEAKRLVDKYYNLFTIYLENTISIYEAAQCAIKTVDEILNADIPITDSEDADCFYNYWTEVYTEIENYED